MLNEFLVGVKEALATDVDLNLETVFEDLEEWDSLGIMTTLVFLDKKYGFKATVNELFEYRTVGELYDKIK